MSPFIATGALWLIGVYQQTLSPDHGPLRVFFPRGVCRYEPTCSNYMAQAITRYEWRGLWIGLRRLIRCHPLATSGRDPLPTTL